MQLPPGCALWRALGGPMAWSDEVSMMTRLDYDLRVLAWQQSKDGKNNHNQPQPLDPPPSRLEERAEQTKLDRRAQKFLEREQRAIGGG